MAERSTLMPGTRIRFVQSHPIFLRMHCAYTHLHPGDLGTIVSYQGKVKNPEVDPALAMKRYVVIMDDPRQPYYFLDSEIEPAD